MDLAVLSFLHAHGDPILTTGVVFEEDLLTGDAAPRGRVCREPTGACRLAEAEPGKLFSGSVLLAAAFGTGALIEFFKFLFDRPRPPVSLQIAPETGLGFPSGHAATALALEAVALYLWNLRPPESWGGSWRVKVRAALIVVALVFLIGVGRLYKGAALPERHLGWMGDWRRMGLHLPDSWRGLPAFTGERVWRWNPVRLEIALSDGNFLGCSN